jgi:hypothetical protein
MQIVETPDIAIQFFLNVNLYGNAAFLTVPVGVLVVAQDQ